MDLTPKSVLECLCDAKEQLDQALLRLARGESLGELSSTSEDNATTTTTVDDDPDDLAAAFFAQQARKQQAEMKLPIHEWAQIIHAVSQTRGMVNGNNLDHRRTPGKDDKSENVRNDVFCTADDLWNEFQVAYGKQ